VVQRVEECRERIASAQHEMAVMSTEYQQLVDRIRRLEAAVELKTNEYKHVCAAFNFACYMHTVAVRQNSVIKQILSNADCILIKLIAATVNFSS